jgi:small-conductance mechanosensitive channel
MPFDPQFWTDTFSDIVANTLNWLPALVGALLWLLLGWIVARIAQFILANLLRRLGLDRVSERAGITQVLTDAHIEPSVSRLTARLVYWLILLVFVLAAAESLGLSAVADTLGTLVSYLPNVLAAALILVIGGLIARLVGDGLGALAVQSGLSAGVLLGQAVRYVLLVFVVILALGQLGIETTLLTTVTVVLITAIALALALAFGIGSRDVARNIMAGMHAKESFTIGQALKVGDISGRVVSVGTVKTVIETGDGLVSLPNTTLIDQEVTLVPDGPEVEAGEEKAGK